MGDEKRDQPQKYRPCQHRLEAFHVICRDCPNRDVFFALDPDRPHLGLRAICQQCGTWEYLE